MLTKPPAKPANPRPPTRAGKRKERPTPRPLTHLRLEELALAYTARFATSAARLAAYLARKLRQHGWAEGEDDPAETRIAALVARCVAVGYVDDAGFAQGRANSLLRRGLGARRIAGALAEAGIAEDIRASVLPDARAGRQAALVYARKRRLGPFGAAAPDPRLAQKHLAAMLRAGHGIEVARAVLRAPSVAEAEAWAAEDGAD